MPFIVDRQDLEWYRDKFGDVWKSAQITVSTVEIGDTQIPQGELIFSRAQQETYCQTKYREGEFSIQQLVTDSPFGLIKEMINGKIPKINGGIQVECDLYQRNPATFFQGNLPEGLVNTNRPQLEVNAALDVSLPESLEDEYSDVVDDLDDRVMRADEPYYSIGQCEEYYFDILFRVERDRPKLLLFADPGMKFDITDQGELLLEAPTGLFQDLFVSILPRRPSGEYKGRRIIPEENKLKSLDEGRSRYSVELDFDGIDELFALLYLNDRMMSMLEHYPGEVVPENPRYEIMEAYDQDDRLFDYLEGNDPNYFEIGVLNTLSTAGWVVQWYGDDGFKIPNFSKEVPRAEFKEIDLIAYHPNGTQILCIECTNTDISNKEQIIDRTAEINSEIQEYIMSNEITLETYPNMVPCIATPRSREELSDDIVQEFEQKDIKILDCERLKTIYRTCANSSDTISVDTGVVELV